MQWSRFLQLPLEIRTIIVDLIVKHPEHIHTHIEDHARSAGIASEDVQWTFHKVTRSKSELRVVKAAFMSYPYLHIDRSARRSCLVGPPGFKKAPRLHEGVIHSCRQLYQEMKGRAVPIHHIYSFRDMANLQARLQDLQRAAIPTKDYRIEDLPEWYFKHMTENLQAIYATTPAPPLNFPERFCPFLEAVYIPVKV